MDQWDKSAVKKRFREKRRHSESEGLKKKRDRTLDLLLGLFVFMAGLLVVIFVIAITG